MSAEFRLSDEHREALVRNCCCRTCVGGFDEPCQTIAVVESIVASEREAARAEGFQEGQIQHLGDCINLPVAAAERALVGRIDAALAVYEERASERELSDRNAYLRRTVWTRAREVVRAAALTRPDTEGEPDA